MAHLPAGGRWCHAHLQTVWKLLLTRWAQCPGESREGRSTWSYCDQGVGSVHVSDSGRCLSVWTFPWAPKEGAPGFLVSFPTSGKRESPDIWLMTKVCSISFKWIWTCLVSQAGALWGLQPEASKRKVKVPSNTLYKSLVCSEKPNACLFTLRNGWNSKSGQGLPLVRSRIVATGGVETCVSFIYSLGD